MQYTSFDSISSVGVGRLASSMCFSIRNAGFEKEAETKARRFEARLKADQALEVHNARCAQHEQKHGAWKALEDTMASHLPLCLQHGAITSVASGVRFAQTHTSTYDSEEDYFPNTERPQ